MKVSIIIPVYNKSDYIERCINSVINQTYQDIECLIVDDCGQDDSILKAHCITDSYNGNVSFIYVTHEKNRGVSAARNSGTEVATGDYIFYLDADDELPLDSIELLMAKVLAYPGIDIVQGNMKRIPAGDDCYELNRFGFPEIYTDNASIRARFYDVWKTFPINPVNKLIRNRFIIDNALFFLEGIIHEDEHWMSKVIKYCSSMVFEYDYTYYRYIIPNSIMTSTDNEKSGYNWGILLYDIACNFEEKDFLLQFRRYLKDWVKWYYKVPYISSLRKAQRQFMKEAIKHHMFYIAFVIFLGGFLSWFEFGKKVGRHLANLWIYRK